jgi:hypothetical protein
MVLILQFGRLDPLELLRQGRHDGQIDQQAVEKSFQEVGTCMVRKKKCGGKRRNFFFCGE